MGWRYYQHWTPVRRRLWAVTDGVFAVLNCASAGYWLRHHFIALGLLVSALAFVNVNEFLKDIAKDNRP